MTVGYFSVSCLSSCSRLEAMLPPAAEVPPTEDAPLAEAALRARTCGLPLSAAAAAAAAAASATAAAAASSAGGIGSEGSGGTAADARAGCPPASASGGAVLDSVAVLGDAPAAVAKGDTVASSSSSPAASPWALPAAPSAPASSASASAAAPDCPVAPLARLLRPSAAATRLLAVENQMEGASGSICTAARSSESDCKPDKSGGRGGGGGGWSFPSWPAQAVVLSWVGTCPH